ncbi:MAG: hypothetical protein ACBR12_22070 [Microcoleus sp.]
MKIGNGSGYSILQVEAIALLMNSRKWRSRLHFKSREIALFGTY